MYILCTYIILYIYTENLCLKAIICVKIIDKYKALKSWYWSRVSTKTTDGTHL